MLDAKDPPSDDDIVTFHESALIARVKMIARDHPEVRMVALVAEADTPEATLLRAAQADSLRGPYGSVSNLITRESAKKLLGQVTPQLLDWLEDEGEGSLRKLPVIHAANRGMRTTSISYDVAY